MVHHGNIRITDNVLSTDIRIIIEPSPGPQECSPGPEELVPAHAFLVSGMMTLAYLNSNLHVLIHSLMHVNKQHRRSTQEEQTVLSR